MTRQLKYAFGGRICLLLAAVLLLFVPVFHAQAENGRKVVDEAGLLSDAEETALEEKFTEIAKQYQCDVVAVTVDNIGGEDITSFADSYFYYNGYGYGDEESGILFLVTMEERLFRLATRGDATEIFTDYGLECIDERVSGELSDGDYYEAFAKFGDMAEQFMEEASKGEPYDVDHTYREPMPLWLRLLIACGVGILAAALTLGVLFSQLRSVRTRHEAWEYVRDGSFHLTRQRDIFLYRTVSRRKIETENNNHPGGGGSTIHSSPGGGHSGGRTGSF